MAAPSQTSESPLAEHLGTPIHLFIHNGELLKLVAAALGALGFTNLAVAKVNPNYFQAMRQLFGDLMKLEEGIILVNHPPQKVKDPDGRQYNDMSFGDFYGGVAKFIGNTRRTPEELLGKCVPVFYSAMDSDIRGKIVEELFGLGVMGAFMLRQPDLGMNRQDVLDEKIDELSGYLSEFFVQKDGKMAQFKEYQSAEELKAKREEADKLMAEVQRLKDAKEFDKAIALCRQATEVLPTDPEAYLEGGRLLVKKKRYTPAMQMFRDAEAVAEALPTPNQEIGNLRVEQAKDYIVRKKAAGEAVDQEVVAGFLNDAATSFRQAIGKASQISTVRGEEQSDKRRDTSMAIAENILTLGLEDYLPAGSPALASLGQLAQETITDQTKDLKEVPPKYQIQFGLAALNSGDYTEAQRHFLEAARHKEVFTDACTKLNYLGTHLRQRGKYDLAMEVYLALLQLAPPFKGVVMFNLAVARMTKARGLTEREPATAKKLEQQAAGGAAEAIYVDPGLPGEENFYQNTVMKPVLARLASVFKGLADAAAKAGSSDLDPAIVAARDKLEEMLGQGQEREALHYMFGLTKDMRPFFTEFDKYVSEPVLKFASLLQPRLGKHPNPQMRVFGKVLGVLLARGQAAKANLGDVTEPLLGLVMRELMAADQAGAAGALAEALYAKPALLKDKELLANQTMLNLGLEMHRKMTSVELDRFGARPTSA